MDIYFVLPISLTKVLLWNSRYISNTVLRFVLITFLLIFSSSCSFRDIEISPFGTIFAIYFASIQLNSIPDRSSLNVLHYLLVGLPLFLLPPTGTHPSQRVQFELLINVEYVQLVSVVYT